MGALFMGASALAVIPAVVLGVNNGFTLLAVIVMAVAAVKGLRGRA